MNTQMHDAIFLTLDELMSYADLSKSFPKLDFYSLSEKLSELNQNNNFQVVIICRTMQ